MSVPPKELARACRPWIYIVKRAYILSGVAKHLVDIDEQALLAAKATLGAATIKETVNRALRQAGAHRAALEESLEVLASADFAPREQAWR